MIFSGLALGFVAMPLLGMKAYVITGASMSGAIERGALIFSKTVPVSSLKEGDIITFCPPGATAPVTHRIASIGHDPAGEPVIQTKGDANRAGDPWRFTLDQPTQAKYVTQIPYAGYLVAAFSINMVRAVLFAVAGLIGIVMIFRHLWRRTGEDTSVGEQGPAAPVVEEILDPQAFRRVDRLKARRRSRWR
jgi:signal peptidase